MMTVLGGPDEASAAGEADALAEDDDAAGDARFLPDVGPVVDAGFVAADVGIDAGIDVADGTAAASVVTQLELAMLKACNVVSAAAVVP